MARHANPPRTDEANSRLSEDIVASQDGAVVAEFAMVAPVFLAMLFGILDVAQMALGRAVLQGAVYEAARSSTLETADAVVSDAIAEGVVGLVLPGAVLTTARRSYYDFDDIDRAEAWNDSDDSGICDNDEIYSDENGNGQWDSDIGLSGNGAAGDVVIFEVTATYEPHFAIPLISEDDERTITATTTFKKNQPYALQRSYGSDTGVCD
ncbi:MAG: pilus assembly protein [Sphingomonadaceae bacterium]|nr:pilus assembly protein [Sphingomonadaceae bacterium]